MKNLISTIALFTCFHGFTQTEKILDLQTDWKFTIGDREEYADVNYDDRTWENVRVPSAWEDEGFLSYNGFAWYRYSFDGSKLNELGNLTLNLGYIDDVNETYFNGELIGFKGSFPPKFYTAYDALVEYQIPEELIRRDGKNTIAIKVYDVHLAGGIVRGDVGIYFEPKFPDDYFTLEGIWKFSARERQNWKEPDFDDEEWYNIVVPSYWRNIRLNWWDSFGLLTRFAYYRKEFELPSRLKNEELYLMLGLIDDFDKTYLNGELIGRTKDHMRFGESKSYQEYRIYKMPSDLINQNGRNVISVEVEDIGRDAGIYEGPVGIVTEEDLAKAYKGRD
jgi:sialate O-acetylesterase